MSVTLDAVHNLEDKIHNLLSNYEFLKNENDILLKNATQLQNKILEKEQLIIKQQQEIELLKIAKTIQGSSTDSKDTKLKINALIREIDKCIIQLQE